MDTMDPMDPIAPLDYKLNIIVLAPLMQYQWTKFWKLKQLWQYITVYTAVGKWPVRNHFFFKDTKNKEHIKEVTTMLSSTNSTIYTLHL